MLQSQGAQCAWASHDTWWYKQTASIYIDQSCLCASGYPCAPKMYLLADMQFGFTSPPLNHQGTKQGCAKCCTSHQITQGRRKFHNISAQVGYVLLPDSIRQPWSATSSISVQIRIAPCTLCCSKMTSKCDWQRLQLFADDRVCRQPGTSLLSATLSHNGVELVQWSMKLNMCC